MLEKNFDPESIEKKQYERWSRSGAFACDPAGKAAPFTIMMPPPNVTGSLHMGHALTMTLQDILIRYYRMNGRDALWQPGTDHAGIATQMVVERMLDQEGTSRKELGREEFLKRVWDWKDESGGTIVSQLKRLGTTPDWERERFTMDEGLSRAVIKVFVELYNEGLIYKDNRLVNWDPKLRTAISDLEVEQKEQKGKMWHLRYPVEGPEEHFITVATTRPETMLGDTAVAVHPDDPRYKDLIGTSVSLPITGRLIPIIADEYADPEQGSGAVKITPAHDFNDFEVGKRHDLPMVNVFDKSARILARDDIPESYHGLDRYEARKKVLAELDEMDLLAEVETIKNSVPYGDRSGVVIEPFLTEQWYCRADVLAKPALEAVKSGKTQFVPKNWENTYFRWLEDIQPWCISRQLWWGHQIPAWYGPDGHVFVAETQEAAQAQADTHYEKTVVLEQDKDVLDTWFSSALWPFSTLDWPEDTAELQKYFPGDVLVTGFDIIFFWVARMMMMSLHFMKEVPFKTVYIHSLVRDSKGQKMSKSKGNVIDPLDLIEKYGTDALRFTMAAMAAPGRDLRLSEQRVEGYRNFATKLWNAARYCEMNGCGYPADFDPASVSYGPNKWIIGALLQTKESMDKAVAAYRFHDMADAVYHFTWGTFCDWYLELTKSVLQDKSNPHAQEVKDTTGWVLAQVISILNPLMPFITEELHTSLFSGDEDELLLSSRWPTYDFTLDTAQAQSRIEWLIRVVSQIRSVRADMNVPAGAQIPLLVKEACPETKEGFAAFGESIKRMARLSDITFSNEMPKGSLQVVIDQTTYILPVADIIDLDAERTRLRKKIKKTSQDIDIIDKKLGNKKFTDNAPADVVAEQQARRESAEQVRRKLEQALAQLDTA